MAILRSLLSLIGINSAPAENFKIDPLMGDQLAQRFRAELAFGDYRGVQRHIENCRDWNERWFYIGALSQWPGRPRWMDTWVDKEMKSAIGWLIRGAHSIHWAEELQNANKFGIVTEEHRSLYQERLQKAEQDLQMACWLDGEDPTPWAFLLKTGVALQVNSREIETRFREATDRDEEHHYAHSFMMQSLYERWGGLHQMMFDFARRTTANAREGSSLYSLIAEAHIERWLYHLLEEDKEGATKYFRNAAVGREIASAAIRSIHSISYRKTKMTIFDHHIFAFCFWQMNNKNLAKREFQSIGTQVTAMPWYLMGDPLKTFLQARQEVMSDEK